MLVDAMDVVIIAYGTDTTVSFVTWILKEIIKCYDTNKK